jgi:hypothetical protein
MLGEEVVCVTNKPPFGRRLSKCCERPRNGRAAEKRDEIASSHVPSFEDHAFRKLNHITLRPQAANENGTHRPPISQ